MERYPEAPDEIATTSGHTLRVHLSDDPPSDRERPRLCALSELRPRLPRRHLLGADSAGLPT